MKVGIVGKPNAGKTTIFNALTHSTSHTDSYPFTTIDPNIGYSFIQDKRLDTLSKIVSCEEVIYPKIKIIDIAGLVEGASEGAGLGNQFLSHIRGMDAIILLLDAFSDQSEIYEDFMMLKNELALSDIEIIERRIEKLKNRMKGVKKNEYESELKLYRDVQKYLYNNSELEESLISKIYTIKDFDILTAIPFIVVLNINDKDIEKDFSEYAERIDNYLKIPVLLEEEFSQLEERDRNEMMEVYNYKETKLDLLKEKLILLLNQIVFYTLEGDIAQGWLTKKENEIRTAVSQIHSELAERFIKAEVINADRLIEEGSVDKAKSSGLYEIKGKDYNIKDGDCIKVITG